MIVVVFCDDDNGVLYMQQHVPVQHTQKTPNTSTHASLVEYNTCPPPHSTPMYIHTHPHPPTNTQMLTLASNERIPLTPTMRLLLEINHMHHCSPATVSRGGVIFINGDDVGWEPLWQSWLTRLPTAELQPLLQALGSKYLEGCMEYARRHCATVVPLPPINMVQTVCGILDGMLPKVGGVGGGVV